MELLEILWVLSEGWCCFLECMAVGTDVGAGVAATKARSVRQKNKAARAAGDLGKRSNAWLWLFCILLPLGLFLTGWSVWKWLRHLGWW